MKTIRLSISDLQHPKKNIRRHPEKQIKEMKRSIEKFGQFRPVVVDENNTILCGNGLVIAMREMGYTEADVLKYNDLSENDKKKLMMADNQLASLGVDDYGAIEEFIRSMEGDIDIPGYDEETLKLIIDETDNAMNAVMSYGVYDDDDIDTLRTVEQDREEKGIQPVQQTYETNGGNNVSAPTETYAETDGSDSEKVYAKLQESERYTVCPHCGMKIYI